MMDFSLSAMSSMLLLLTALLCGPRLAEARTILVDAKSATPANSCTGQSASTACPTIESGLLLAASNDTVLIEPGQYSGAGNEGLVFGNSSDDIVGVTLRGNLVNQSNSAVRIVCKQNNRFLASFNNFFSQISDFSIENCRTSGQTGAGNINVGGGGLEVIRSSGIDIVNVAFTNNTARYGGGMLVQDSSSVRISECFFVNNVAVYWGGGLKAFASGVTIQSSVFMSNQCDGSLIDDPYFNANTENVGGGGAVHSNRGSYISVISSQFLGNSAKVMAGAFCVTTMGSASFKNAVFDGNTVQGGDHCFNDANCKIRAGALLLSSTVTVISDTNFTNNFAATSDISKFAEGGALYVSKDSTITKNSDLTLTRLLFTNNSAYGTGDNNAGGHGGAIFMNGINIFLSHSTFKYNFARSDGMFTEYPSAGGALYLSEDVTTTVQHCSFFNNFVQGGRAGAVFATDSTVLLIYNSTLRRNHVTSSYNFKSSGGAISIAQRATAEIQNCTFQRNFANPKVLVSPRTYSGVGGAIFIESAAAIIADNFFFDNFASSGQFDSGGSGGAIGMENCHDIQILRSMFVLNSARGYDDSNTYSSSGSGGAISSMFSSAYVESCLFSKNMVTAGGAEFSVGGAVTVFYNFLETANTPAAPPFQFHNCEFNGNAANGEVCSAGQIVRAGQGGAVAIIGVSNPGVLFNQTSFTRNIANTESEGFVSSFGGAVFYGLGSKAIFYETSLLKNVAYNGLGDDICSGFGGEFANDLELYEPYLDSVTTLEARLIHASLLSLVEFLCDSFDIGIFDEVRLPLSVKEWSSRWDEYFAKFADPWYGVHFVEDPVTVEVDDAYANPYRSWGIYEEIVPGYSARAYASRPEELRQFPSILITSGVSRFYQPSILNHSYQICAADLLGLLAGQGQGQSSGDTSNLRKPSLTIVGDVQTSALEIVALAANVTIIDRQSRSSIMIKSIVIINSTLYHSNNVNVSSISAIVGCTVSSFIPVSISNATINLNYMPVITYSGSVVTGFASDDDVQVPFIQLIQNKVFSAENYFMRSSIRIMGSITFSTVSNQEDHLVNNTILFISLLNRSTFLIESSGEMMVDSLTNIITENVTEIAIVNAGIINIGNGAASHTTGLRVYGNIRQTMNATTMIRISNDDYDTPALVMASNHSFFGNLNVTTIDGTTFIPASDSDTPSSWRIIEYFDSISASAVSGLGVHSYYPSGLYFEETTHYTGLNHVVMNTVDLKSEMPTSLNVNLKHLKGAGDDSVRGHASSVTLIEPSLENDIEVESWVESITSSAMSCAARNDYYDFEGKGDSVDYRCFVCLKNASCGYCAGVMGGCQSISSVCSDGAYFQEANCCPKGCNNRGTCESNDDLTSFTCECNIFWDGSSCDDLSIFTYLLTSVGVFSIVIALITLRYYFKYRHQKRKVLHDLRENLLGGGQHGGSMTNQSYLQGIQQDLILRDVFVPYDEIKLEKKIGEGSFGEVFMATFRGAQVAVKQMRAPVFLQFTDNDIEEFRKEAYMMSRLRHPNIVLVMGVSMLEQEAPQPPPGYDDDEDLPPKGRTVSTDSQNGGAKRTLSTDHRGSKKPELKIRSVCIITEYLEQGSLADILYGHNKVSDDVWTYELVLTCALQAARGMLYLHSYQPPICHRDLKSSNLVVDDHWVVKVTDFGMSRIVPTKIQNIETGIDKDPNETILSEVDTKRVNEETGSVASTRRVGFDVGANEYWERESFIDVDNMMDRNSNTEMTSNLGTTAWCAPELLVQGVKTKYSVKVDVYSFGMVLWELWERKKPYEEMTSRFDIIDAVREGRRPPISPNCPPTFRSLIQRCWHELPARRPTFAYIVRYIKDELAHIKRQRNMSTSFSPYSVSHLLNTQSSSGMDPSSAAKAVQRAYNNSISVTSPQTSADSYTDNLGTSYVDMNDSYIPPVIEEDDERDGSIRKSSSLLSFMFKHNSNATKSSSNSEKEKISSSSATHSPLWATTSTTDITSERNTLHGDAQGPSATDLSHLAQTPKESSFLERASSIPELQAQEQREQQKDYTDGATVQQGPPPGMRSTGQWRDKYVLKFNGWNSTKPDSNLPPASSRAHPPIYTTSSTVNQQQAPASALHQVPQVVDEQSSEGSAGRQLSTEDFKEVYAHGQLLQPRTTYELDLMSTRSADPHISNNDTRLKSSQEDKLQRKRTNSL